MPTPSTSDAPAVDAPARGSAGASPSVIRHERDTHSLFSVRIHPEDTTCEECE